MEEKTYNSIEEALVSVPPTCAENKKMCDNANSDYSDDYDFIRESVPNALGQSEKFYMYSLNKKKKGDSKTPVPLIEIEINTADDTPYLKITNPGGFGTKYDKGVIKNQLEPLRLIRVSNTTKQDKSFGEIGDGIASYYDKQFMIESWTTEYYCSIERDDNGEITYKYDDENKSKFFDTKTSVTIFDNNICKIPGGKTIDSIYSFLRKETAVGHIINLYNPKYKFKFNLTILYTYEVENDDGTVEERSDIKDVKASEIKCFNFYRACKEHNVEYVDVDDPGNVNVVAPTFNDAAYINSRFLIKKFYENDLYIEVCSANKGRTFDKIGFKKSLYFKNGVPIPKAIFRVGNRKAWDSYTMIIVNDNNGRLGRGRNNIKLTPATRRKIADIAFNLYKIRKTMKAVLNGSGIKTITTTTDDKIIGGKIKDNISNGNNKINLHGFPVNRDVENSESYVSILFNFLLMISYEHGGFKFGPNSFAYRYEDEGSNRTRLDGMVMFQFPEKYMPDSIKNLVRKRFDSGEHGNDKKEIDLSIQDTKFRFEVKNNTQSLVDNFVNNDKKMEDVDLLFCRELISDEEMESLSNNGYIVEDIRETTLPGVRQRLIDTNTNDHQETLIIPCLTIAKEVSKKLKSLAAIKAA